MIHDSFLLFPLISAFTFAALLFGVLAFAFWIWMIVDCVTRKFKSNTEKIVWILVILFATWVGSIVYFVAIKKMNPKGLM